MTQYVCHNTPVWVRDQRMSVELKSGSEGPRHDPYSYEEAIVRDRGVTTTGHVGLGCFVRYEGDGDSLIVTCADTAQVNQAMATFCGVTMTQARRWDRKAQEARLRSHRAHGGAEWARGFPGESMLVCRCGAVIDSSFNRSAVE